MPPGRLGRLLAIPALLVVSACASEATQRPPAAPDDGIELTGTLDGAQVAVTDGEPEVLLGDCDVGEGRDRDLCVASFTIDGRPLGLVIENPSALEVGTTLPVVDPRGEGCLPACDDLRGAVVIDVRAGRDRQYAIGGSAETTEVGDRVAVRLRLELPDGRLTGGFNVRASARPAPGPT